MAHSLSAKKRMRQNVKERARNRTRKAQLKDKLKGFDTALKTGDAAKTLEALKVAVQKIDRTAAKKTLHKNTAARRKSLLQRRYNALKAGGSKATAKA